MKRFCKEDLKRALWGACGGTAIGLAMTFLLMLLGFLTVLTVMGQATASGTLSP